MFQGWRRNFMKLGIKKIKVNKGFLVMYFLRPKMNATSEHYNTKIS